MPKRLGADRLDQANLRKVLQTGQGVWTGIGVVHVPQDAASHYEIVTDAGEQDVLVEILLAPHGEAMTARLGAGGGVWRIPAVGAEVAVVIPQGSYDCDALIVADFSAGSVPDGLDGSTIVIAARPGSKVLVHSGDASDAEPLATKADVQALRDELEDIRLLYDTHLHDGPVVAGGVGVGSTGLPKAPFLTPGPLSNPEGTNILEAE